MLQNFKEVCQRFISIFGHPSQFPTSTLNMACLKCGEILCNESCMIDPEEIIIFDFGTKLTYFKYVSESKGQLSMHPTVGPLVVPTETTSPPEASINLNCPICSKMVRRKEANDALEASSFERLHKNGQSRIANALSKLSFRNLHCFDTTHSVDDAVLLSETDVPLTCIMQKTLPIQVHSVTPDIGTPVQRRSCRQTDAGCPHGEHLSMYMFLIEHMLKRNPFFHVQSIPFVMCEPTDCDGNMKSELIRYVMCDLKAPGSEFNDFCLISFERLFFQRVLHSKGGCHSALPRHGPLSGH